MEDPRFFRIHVIVRDPNLKPGKMTLKWESEPEDRGAEDIRTVYLGLPDDDEPHLILGQYMDAWSRLEQAIANLLIFSTDLKYEHVHIFMNQLGMNGSRDIISTLAPPKLRQNQTVRLTALLDAVKTNATRRNRIIHGSWCVEARIYDWNGRTGAKGFIYRVYDPADPAVREAMVRGKDKDARKAYMFSLGRIQSLTRVVKQLATKLNHFTSEVAQRPIGPPPGALVIPGPQHW